jgi:hypothetical protein
VGSAWKFVIQFRWYVALLVLCVRRAEWRLVTVCLVPALLTFAYLTTVTQIMGFDSRYYMPYLAFFVVPALLVLDRRLVMLDRRLVMLDRRLGEVPRAWDAQKQWGPRAAALHLLAAGAVLAVCVWSVPTGVARVIDRKLVKGNAVYEPAILVTAGDATLPEVPYLAAMWAVTDTLMAPLPAGVTIAASEVGYLGAHAPQATIIDAAGLNDTQIALHGFSMAALLARKPDVIWMPHPDYTYQRGLMLSDPALLQQYEVYADAANYGLAVRKDSPYRAQIEMRMLALWARLYPGQRMQDDLVKSVQWSGKSHGLAG